MIYSIYKIYNTIDDNCYIGYTKKDINIRFKEHINEAKRGSNKKLKIAMRKIGFDEFNIILLETTDKKSEAVKLEIDYISKFDSRTNGYNMTIGGDGSDWSKGLTYDEMYSKEIADKMRNKMKGKNNPSVTNDVSGKNNGFYGKTHSDSVKVKIGNAAKNRVWANKSRELVSRQKMGENNPMKQLTGFKHHSSKAYIIYNPIEDIEILLSSGAGKYLRNYGLTLNTLLGVMNGIFPKRNKEKYENIKWKIFEVRRIKL